jgi:tetratricopeptide (TPR) repeat protein
VDSVEGTLQGAAALIEVGRYREAIALLHQALARSPEESQILCKLSLAHLRLGDHQTSLRFADQAVAAEPDAEWGHRLRSVALGGLGKHALALKAAEEAVRCAPELPHALSVLCEAQLDAKPREAEQTAEQLRSVAPDWCNTWLTSTLVSLQRKRWKEAEERSRKALTLDPESFVAMNNLGVALLNQKRRLEAVETFQRAAALAPNEETARSNLKLSVSKYLGASALVLWLLLHAASGGPAVLALALVGVAIFFVIRWYRFRQLPEGIKAYVRSNRQVWFPPAVQQKPERLLLLVVKTLFWGTGIILLLLLLANMSSLDASQTWKAWVAIGLLGSVLLAAALIPVVRRRRAARRESV